MKWAEILVAFMRSMSSIYMLCKAGLRRCGAQLLFSVKLTVYSCVDLNSREEVQAQLGAISPIGLRPAVMKLL